MKWWKSKETGLPPLEPAPVAVVDPGMNETAAMVYVGDVYSLLALNQVNAHAAASRDPQARDTVWPFIR